MSKLTTTANRGGVTALVSLIRRLDEYENWKRAVFIRDRFTCQQCGRRNGRKPIIEAHHLTELSALVRLYKITSLDEAQNCPLLWEVSNGQTLCKSCHELTDSYPVNFRTKRKPAKRKATKI